MNAEPVIIVKKPARKGPLHHGGAWKVAYADFVTAMMAFFLVMWIVGQGPSVRHAVAAYFRDPGVFEYQRQQGVLPGAVSGVGATEQKAEVDVSHANMMLERLAAQLREILQSNPTFAGLRDRVEITLTPEGLRIELLETSNESFFASGSAELRSDSIALLRVIARELSALPNGVVIEGHTDSRPYARGGPYGNWELSTDRSNAARRVMETAGLREGQLEGVRGYADTRLRYADDSLDPRNRRISIVVRNNVPE